ERTTQLLDDRCDHRGCEMPRAGDETSERLTFGPLEREIVESVGFTEVVRADDVGMAEAAAEPGLAQKTLDRDGVLAEPRNQHLDGGHSPLGMLAAIDAGGSPLADVLDEAVACHHATDEVFGAHRVSQPSGSRECQQAPSNAGDRHRVAA